MTILRGAEMDNTKDCSNCGHKDTCATNYCDAIRNQLYNVRDGRNCWVPNNHIKE